MGYEFDSGAQKISYGNHVELYQPQDLSIGFWAYFLPAVSGAKQIIGHEDSFPCIQITEERTLSQGFGFSAFHTKGGSFSFGVTCIPGAINPSYAVPANVWRYFGVTRDYSSSTYFSYFGSRTALIDGPTGTWSPGQEPYLITQPGQNLGPWVIGHQVNGAIIGPAHYWDWPLTKEQHRSMARCTLPNDVGLSHLLWWSKMQPGAADIGPNHFSSTFSSPPPVYVPDDGCASFNTGLDYGFHVA